jgi:GxxExxY protein
LRHEGAFESWAGLLESAYEESLCYELSRSGVPFRRQVDTTLRYEGINLATGLRIDLVVDDRAIIEVKAVENLLPIHEAQLLTYLRCSGIRLGLLMNFNVRHFREGVRRRVL